MTAFEHGTPAGFRRHYRDGQPPCEPCRTAYNFAANTRNRALAELARSYPDEFQALLIAEEAAATDRLITDVKEPSAAVPAEGQ